MRVKEHLQPTRDDLFDVLNSTVTGRPLAKRVYVYMPTEVARRLWLNFPKDDWQGIWNKMAILGIRASETTIRKAQKDVLKAA